jgi:glycosyltransferase involved in cell wall biosynthesis
MKRAESIPKTLLLTGGVPGSTHAGNLFLDELGSRVPAGRLCRFSLALGNDEGAPSSWFGHAADSASYPYEGPFWRFGGHFPSLTVWLRHQYLRRIHVPHLLRRIVAFARREKVELLWVGLTSPLLIYLAEPLARALGCPLVVTVCDPPERWETQFQLDSYTGGCLQREFTRAMKASLRIGVASEGMKNVYRARYGRESVVLIHGVTKDLRRPPAQELQTPGELRIGFAGNLYAAAEWYALLKALASVNWAIEGRRVRMRVLAPDLVMQRQGACNVEFLGWRSLTETIACLAEMDVNYLPYWFESRFRPTVQQCFPNKMTPYLASGRPVFYHGPVYATPTEFLHRYPAGLLCHSLDSKPILAELRKLVLDAAGYPRMTQAGQRALDEELNLGVFLGRFAELLGIDPSLLNCETTVIPL